ncbi:uncharacterized protein L201_003581 [Kwoniella dendrophila CBS 6074]|uniref:Uncharacterized protein n=1 Tax=Kwoniella dendrophila CBS 6074 TaxID=1295534 RepID=A0AAX4JUY8_9TREE
MNEMNPITTQPTATPKPDISGPSTNNGSDDKTQPYAPKIGSEVNGCGGGSFTIPESKFQPYAPTDPHPTYSPPKKKNLFDRIDDKLDQIGKDYKNSQQQKYSYNIPPDPCGAYYPPPASKYQTYEQRRKRKKAEKGEIIGAAAEVAAALHDRHSGEGGGGIDGGGAGDGGGASSF